MPQIKYSIVIPCYNEEKNIPLTLKKYADVIKRDDIEVLIVENGSTDGSATLLEKIIPKYPFARIVKVAINQGYGHGILKGLESTQGEFIGWSHADMQTNPADVVKAFEIVEKNDSSKNLFVKGLRINRPLKDQLFTGCMSIIESVLFRTFLQEINAQPNIFHRSFYQQWVNPPTDFSLDLFAIVMAKKNKMNIIRFNVLFPERIHGTSNWSSDFKIKIRTIKKTLSFSCQLKKRLSQ